MTPDNVKSILWAYLRLVLTKWETSHKISFPSYCHIHVTQILSFKMIYNMSGLLLHFGSKSYYFLEKLLVFYWFPTCSVSHISFTSLATCRSFCENRFHLWLQIANRIVCWISNFSQINMPYLMIIYVLMLLDSYLIKTNLL